MDTAKQVDNSRNFTEHMRATGTALFVTVLWASSWVIIKFGLSEISPLTFAGLRYSIAAGILMGWIATTKENRSSLKGLDWRETLVLVGYGLIFVAVTQGAQFIGLDLLDAIAVSLLLNMTPIIVLFLGIVLLKEIPTAAQLGLILIGILGVLMYFYPFEVQLNQTIGLIVVIGGVISNALSTIMGRAINREKKHPPVIITGVSMLAGSIALLGGGLLLEGMPVLSGVSIFYVLWLSIINTAFAFTLWNKAMQKLRAIDTSVINGAMFPQIVCLSVIFLGEVPTILDWMGLLLVGISAVAIQVIQARRESQADNEKHRLQ